MGLFLLTCMQCFLTLITLFSPLSPSLFSIATMSGRWPVSILSQAYPRKTTASLSSTNSKSLVFALRMPLGSIFEHCITVSQLLMCRQHCICHPLFSVLPFQFKASFIQCFVSYLHKFLNKKKKKEKLPLLLRPFIYCISGLLFSTSANAELVILILRADNKQSHCTVSCIHQLVGMLGMIYSSFLILNWTRVHGFLSCHSTRICPPTMLCPCDHPHCF